MNIRTGFRPRRFRRGSMLALSVIIALLVTVAGASVINMTNTSMRVAEARLTEQNLLYVAETGMDQAVSTLYRYLEKSTNDGVTWISPQPSDALQEWTATAGNRYGRGGWTSTTDGFRKDFGVITLGNNRQARLRVLVRNVPNPSQMSATPEVISEVTYDPDSRNRALGPSSYSKQYRLVLSRTSRYQNSLVGIKGVTFGDSMSVNSYNSLVGMPGPTNLGDKAVVASPGKGDAAIVGSNPSVYGYVVTGGDDPTDNFGTGTRVFGSGSPPPYSGTNGHGIDPQRVTHDFAANFPVAKTPPASGLLDLNLVLQGLPVTSGVILLPAGSYKLSNPLNLPQTITQTKQVVNSVTTWVPLIGNVTQNVVNTVTEELTVSTIRVVGNVTIVVDGDPNADPKSTPSIKLSGNTQLELPLDSSLKIYTPGNVELGGAGLVNGVLAPLSTSGRPQNFMVFGTNNNIDEGKRQSIVVAGAGCFSGVIDAPNADVILRAGSDSTSGTLVSTGDTSVTTTSGSSGLGVGATTPDLDLSLSLPSGTPGLYGFQGAIIGYTVRNDGKFAFHYDEALGKAFMFPVFWPDAWVELKGSNRVTMSDYGF